MKKILLIVVVFATILSSCSNNGNKAKTKDAEKVNVVTNDKTNSYNQIHKGSLVHWRASHLGGLQPRFGNINVKSASVLVNDNTISNATIIMDMSTITVESFPAGSKEKKDLTGHLQSGDFFNVQSFPTSKFELTGLKTISGKFNSEVTGNLTIKNATKSITFKANIMVDDNIISISSEDFSVDRTDWGLKYNVEGTAGVPTNYLIANDIGFTIELKVEK